MGIHRYNEDLFLPELMKFISENNLSQTEHMFLLELAKNYYSSNEFQKCWVEKYKVSYDLVVDMFVNMTSDEFFVKFDFVNDWFWELELWCDILEKTRWEIKERWMMK